MEVGKHVPGALYSRAFSRALPQQQPLVLDNALDFGSLQMQSVILMSMTRHLSMTADIIGSKL